MEIAAHKDLETGRIFETPGALADFQEERRKAAEAAARIVAIKARLIELRSVVLSTMKTPSDLCTLVRDTYQEVLKLMQELVELRGVKRTKAEMKKRIEVVKVEACNFRWEAAKQYDPKAGLYLQVALKVTLSDEPYGKLFCDEMPNLDFSTVMTGARVYGGNSGFDEQAGTGGTYSKHYTTHFPLERLPLMRPRLVELAAVSQAKDDHERKVQSAQMDAFNENPEVHAISAELAEAERVLAEARKARDAVQQRMDAKDEAISAEVAKTMPFADQATLDAGLQEGFFNDIRGLDLSSLTYYLS